MGWNSFWNIVFIVTCSFTKYFLYWICGHITWQIDLDRALWFWFSIMHKKQKNKFYFLQNKICRIFIFCTQKMNSNPKSSILVTLVKFRFTEEATKIDKSSPMIWHLLHNVKSTVKILSNYVAVLEIITFTRLYNPLCKRSHCFEMLVHKNQSKFATEW